VLRARLAADARTESSRISATVHEQTVATAVAQARRDAVYAFSATLGASRLRRTARWDCMQALRRWQEVGRRGVVYACHARTHHRLVDIEDHHRVLRSVTRHRSLRDGFARLLTRRRRASDDNDSIRRVSASLCTRTLARSFKALAIRARIRRDQIRLLSHATWLTRHWRVCSVMRAWRQHTRRRAVIAASILRTHLSFSCLCNLRSRQYAFDGWQRHNYERVNCHLSLIALRRRSRGASHRSITLSAWAAWRTHQRSLSRLRGALSMWRSRGTRRAWSTWRASCVARRRLQCVVIAMQRQREVRAWRAWLAFSHHRSSCASMLNCIRTHVLVVETLRYGHGRPSAARAFRTWRAASKGRLARLTVVMLICRRIRASERREQSRALTRWVLTCARLARAKHTLCAASSWWLVRGCSHAWHQWRRAMHGSWHQVRAARSKLIIRALNQSFTTWVRRVIMRTCVRQIIEARECEVVPLRKRPVHVLEPPDCPLGSSQSHVTSPMACTIVEACLAPASAPAPPRTPPRRLAAPILRILVPSAAEAETEAEIETKNADDVAEGAARPHSQMRQARPQAQKPEAVITSQVAPRSASSSLLRHTHASRGWENSARRLALESQPVHLAPFRPSGSGIVTFDAPCTSSMHHHAKMMAVRRRPNGALSTTYCVHKPQERLAEPSHTKCAVSAPPAMSIDASLGALAFAPQPSPTRRGT